MTVFVYDYRLGRSAAMCSCGWSGRRRQSKALAKQDAWSHFIATRCELANPLVITHPSRQDIRS